MSRSQYHSHQPPVGSHSFEEERHVVTGDIECLIEQLNSPRADVKDIATRLEQISREVTSILMPVGRTQGNSGYNNLPLCFEERCRMVSLQIREYGMELTHSPNLAYHIGWALYGIVFLVGSLKICDCDQCDDYAKHFEVCLTRYTRQVNVAPQFCTGDLWDFYAQIRINFQLLRFRPTDSECRCGQCVSRSLNY